MDIYNTDTDVVTNPHHRHVSIGARGRLRCLAVIAMAAIGAACGSSEPEITPATVGGDQILFQRGTAALADNNWLEARNYFLRVRDNYPQSGLRADARLGVGDSFEGQGGAASYVSALAEYQDFLSLYPTHPRAGYAQFKLAMVHHHQMRPPERDQSWTQSAIREFELFVERYPDSELVGEVRGYLREAKDRLSESEFIVGRYYHRNKWWPGAIERLGTVVDSNPEFAGRELVYFYLADAFYNGGQLAKALPMFQRLLDEFPDTEFGEDVTEAVADIETRLDAEVAATPDPVEAGAGTDEPDATESAISG